MLFLCPAHTDSLFAPYRPRPRVYHGITGGKHPLPGKEDARSFGKNRDHFLLIPDDHAKPRNCGALAFGRLIDLTIKVAKLTVKHTPGNPC